MPNYVYTVDGNEELYFGLMGGGTVTSDTPPPTPATPTEQPPPEPPPPTPTEPPPPTVFSGGSCQPLPVKVGSVPESVASAFRNGDQGPFVAWFYSLPHYPYDTPNYDPVSVLALLSSPTPSIGVGVTWTYFLDPFSPLCEDTLQIRYNGLQPLPPSVPGTVIEDTPTTGGGYPVPPVPPILPEIDTRVRTSIDEPVQEARQCKDRLTGQIRGQIDYQLAQAGIPIPKLQQKIESNVMNTLGEVYQEAYPIGLGIPTTEQIISGEPVYSPYGIGATIPYCDEATTTPTTGGGYPVPPSTQPPGVTCPAPVVQCPPPPAINVNPVINVNVPQQGGPTITVTTPTPTPTPTEPTPTPTPTPTTEPEEPEEPTYPTVVVVEPPAPTEPTPTPTPPPTPPAPTPAPTPTPPKPAGLDLGDLVLNTTNDPWATGAPCGGAAVTLADPASAIWSAFGWSKVGAGEYRPPDYLNPTKYPTGFQWFGSFAMNLVGTLIDSTAKTFNASLPIINNPSDFIPLTIGGFVQNWIGAPVLQFMQSNIYNINFNNPQRIPSEAEIVSLYLANEIDEGQMRCLVRANGSYDTWYSKIANANRTRISNEQIIQLYRRGIIPGSYADKALRDNGILNQNEANMLYRATESMPSVSDIVRFMVRDADDNAVAAKYGTDAAFDAKYGEQLKSWARGQGITDDVLKYYWRSHWEIPSNTALFEMLHRLRPNRQSSAGGTGVTVTTNDIKDALVVNDMLPFWADRMIEISYRPLTRTDAQRAYFIDALSEIELKDAYLDIGYSDSNADKLVRFTRQLKAQRKQAKGGTEKATSVLRYYKSWLIGETEARQRLVNGGLSEQGAMEALAIADNQRKNESQLLCIKGVKSKYKKYQITDLQAQQELTAIGMAVENIAPTIRNWNCERSFKPKELTLAQVCKAYQNNLIDDVEYRRRLSAIGYMEDESGILLEICASAKSNKNTGKGDTTRIRSTEEKQSQTEAARAITAAALEAAASQETK